MKYLLLLLLINHFCISKYLNLLYFIILQINIIFNINIVKLHIKLFL